MKTLKLLVSFVLWFVAVHPGQLLGADPPPPPVEIWMAKGTSWGGTGTLLDPYTVSTPEEFDSRLYPAPEIPEGSVIHILPGVYETMGRMGEGVVGQGFFVKSGWHIRGAGVNKTIIKLVAAKHFINQGYQNCVFATEDWPNVCQDTASNYQDIAIYDLTVDCNYDALANTNYMSPNLHLTGVEISGRKNLRIERVLVKNAAAKMYANTNQNSYGEAFVLTIRTCDSPELSATGIMISDCEVSDFKGGYCTAIMIAGKGSTSTSTGRVSGTVQNCRVKFAGVPGDATYSYNSSGANGVLYENNMSWGANRGFNNDYETSEKIALRGNLFLNVTNPGARGAMLIASSKSVLEGNIFGLIGTGFEDGGVAAVSIGGANPPTWSGATNWIIQGNLIFNSGTDCAGISFAAEGNKPVDCVFQDNRMSAITGNFSLTPDTFNNHWYGNTDFSGNDTLAAISDLQWTNRYDSSKNGP